MRVFGAGVLSLCVLLCGCGELTVREVEERYCTTPASERQARCELPLWPVSVRGVFDVPVGACAKEVCPESTPCNQRCAGLPVLAGARGTFVVTLSMGGVACHGPSSDLQCDGLARGTEYVARGTFRPTFRGAVLSVRTLTSAAGAPVKVVPVEAPGRSALGEPGRCLWTAAVLLLLSLLAAVFVTRWRRIGWRMVATALRLNGLVVPAIALLLSTALHHARRFDSTDGPAHAGAAATAVLALTIATAWPGRTRRGRSLAASAAVGLLVSAVLAVADLRSPMPSYGVEWVWLLFGALGCSALAVWIWITATAAGKSST